jgi:flavorubredoxin
MTVKLKENIYWVGAVDWNIRDFHGYITGRGVTYNSYLIIDDKITLIDSVKYQFFSEWLERIRQIVDPAKIDYLICNHIEPDHSGALSEFVRQFPNIKIFSTKMAQSGLAKYYGPGLPVETVKTGDKLKLGKKTLNFLEVPMVHWPDSMFSYMPEDKLLFSNDGFGQHIATSGHFDDEVDESIVMFEAAKYYANLLIHLSPLIQNILKKVSELKLEIDMIAPSHGIIWRKDPGKIIHAYDDWSQYKSKEKVLVIYDTMWGSTEKMAKILVDSVADSGIEVKLIKLRATHRSDIMTEILDSRGFFLGSPTLHGNLFPTISALMCYMKGLKPQKKIVSVFGSYGWSGEAVQILIDTCKEIKLDIIEPAVKVQYMPDDKTANQLKILAGKMVDKIK